MKYIVFLSMSLLLCSCVDESKILLQSLDKYKLSIDYLHDTEIAECDKSTSILFGSFENQAFDNSTSVTMINHKLLPYIIYNYEETNLAVNLGQSSIQQTYSDFFKESFKKESQRTGCYSLTDQIGNNDYNLEIIFNTCLTRSKYQIQSTFLFLLVASSLDVRRSGSPSETDLNLNVKLFKAKHLVFEKRYLIGRKQPFINAQTLDVSKLHSDILTNMVESFSLSTKECIEQIVKDINQVIRKPEG